MSDGTGSGAAVFPSRSDARLSATQGFAACAFVVVGAAYLGWRATIFNPHAALYSITLYAAELFGYACACLRLFTCWRLRSRLAPSPLERASVAVLVTTMDESVDIVRRTVLAGQRMKQATEVWVLDRGDRLEMHVLADELGCRYLSHAGPAPDVAEGLNDALSHTCAQFVAVFGADQAPAHNFLEETLGFFRDDRVAFVQTPLEYYNLDSFQHRLDRRTARVWNEETLSARVLQPGRDRLNAVLLRDSCAVIRRKALDDIGGFATGSVTPELHTSIRLHKRGWNSVYYARSLAFGLAPASAVAYLDQRLRRARGAVQVWRQEGIVFAPALSVGQRASYLATMLAPFEGWQRLVFYATPVIALATGTLPVAQFDRAVLAIAATYYLLAGWAFAECARGYGRSWLTEQYRMLRFGTLMSATGDFLRRRSPPRRKVQGVNARRALWPPFAVMGLNTGAIVVGLQQHVSSGHLAAIALLVMTTWAAVNATVSAIALTHAARAAAQRRREYRFPLPVPLLMRAPSGSTAVALAIDISPLGCRIVGAPAADAKLGDELNGELLLPTGPLPVVASVRVVIEKHGGQTERALGCEFRWGLSDERNQLEMFLFGSDLQWQLNGFSDRTYTPLEQIAAWLGRSPRMDVRRLAGQTWSPVLYKRVNSEHGSGVGFISRGDPKTGARTMVSLGVLPRHGRLYAEEVTAAGPRGVVGRVEDEEILMTHAAPIYLYRLTG